MIEVGRDLWRSSCPILPAQPGPPTAGCPGPCLDSFWIFPMWDAPKPAWVTRANAQSPAQCGVLKTQNHHSVAENHHSVVFLKTQKSVSWSSDGTSCVSVCAHCLCSSHWAPLKRAWLSSLHPPFRLSWFNPSQQLSTTQLLAHSPCVGIGERLGRVKVRKLVGWDKDSLIGKAKAARTSKVKQGIHSPLPISR